MATAPLKGIHLNVSLYPIEWKHLFLFDSFKDLEALAFAAMLSIVAIFGIWHLLPTVINGNMAIFAIGAHFAIAAILTKLSAKGPPPLHFSSGSMFVLKSILLLPRNRSSSIL